MSSPNVMPPRIGLKSTYVFKQGTLVNAGELEYTVIETN